ncbi:MAG: DNA-binding protein [Candidatus Melainabacteria bacterium RIFCSPLOWO2_02_FULL_35_15]|nr:MAG: DNA-binding protein [Candidatus Melainabacteria bacterium RIFCSPLOWO2_02_FULL_35_15]
MSIETIETRIFLIRGKKVMLDKDLAELYKVKPIALRQQVKRNKERFPGDFMFQLTNKEVESMVSQNVIPSKQSLGGHFPYAFTEQGVAMLSSVLNSKRAIMVNIQIIRAFTKLREMIEGNRDLKKKIEEMERKYDTQFKAVFEAIKNLIEPERKPKRKIGFYVANEEINDLKNFKGIKFYDE